MSVGRKAVLFLIILFLYCDALSQTRCTGGFYGEVMSESGETLPGATVLLQPGNLGQATDADGHFHFEGICHGNFRVVVSFIGFRDEIFNVAIQSNVKRVIHLQQQLKELDEVVIKEKILQTTHVQDYVVLGEKDLAKSAGKPLGEMLKEATGVSSIQAGPGIFKPVIHGVHSQRVIILNYGIRQEGQQWGAEHAPEVDPFIASELIVIKDASSIKYGADAIGGVIVVNPPELPEKAGLGGSWNAVGQSNGRSGTISGMLQGGLTNHIGWGWRVQGTVKRAGDAHAADYQLTNTGVSEKDFSAATGYHNDKSGIEVFFSHFQTKLGILRGTAISNQDDLLSAMEREPPQYTSAFSYAIQEPHQEVVHSLLRLNAHHQTKEGEWSLLYGFQDNARKEFDVRSLGVSSKVPAIDLKLYTHTLETEWETTSEARTFCIGLSTMWQDNRNIPGTQRIPFIPNFTSFSGGPFAVARFFRKRWTTDLGIRYDLRTLNVTGYDFKNTLYHANLFFNNVSATAGASVQLDPTSTLSFNVSSAWRPPHVSELYSLGLHQSAASIEYGMLLNDSTNEVMSPGDVSFKIEKAFKGVSTYHYTRGRFDLEATAYANLIFNYIYLRPTGVTQTIRGVAPSFRYTQTDALFLGLDFSSTWKVGDHWRIAPRASLIQASDIRNHDYLIFIPSNRGEVGVRYEKTVKKFKSLFLESILKYNVRQFRAPRVVTVREIGEARTNGTDLNLSDSNFDFMAAPNGYFLLNLSAGFSLEGKMGRYDFRVSAENALNASYREYMNRFRYFADDLGRNFIFSAKYIF